jgi:hypothetical protein
MELFFLKIMNGLFKITLLVVQALPEAEKTFNP